MIRAIVIVPAARGGRIAAIATSSLIVAPAARTANGLTRGGPGASTMTAVPTSVCPTWTFPGRPGRLAESRMSRGDLTSGFTAREPSSPGGPTLRRLVRVMSAMRILSGIQPSAPCTSATTSAPSASTSRFRKATKPIYFVADYHALTSVPRRRQVAAVCLRRARRSAGAGARPGEGHALRPVGRARDDRAGLAA